MTVDPWVAGIVGALAIVCWCVERCVSHLCNRDPIVVQCDREDEDDGFREVTH
jgi:hypothetical protein